MSEKILWNTVKIQVPSDFITVTKNGQIRIKPPLTKKNRISTANKQPAIQFIPADVSEVKIIDQGTKETSDKKIYKTKPKARNEVEEDINVSKTNNLGGRFTKGSEAAKEFMRLMREKRGKK